MLEALVGVLSTPQSESIIGGIADVLESVLEIAQWEDGLKDAFAAQSKEQLNHSASNNNRPCGAPACHQNESSQMPPESVAGAVLPCNGWQCSLGEIPGIEKLYRIGVPKVGVSESGILYGNFSLSYLWDTGDVRSLWSRVVEHNTLAEFINAEPDVSHNLHEIAKHCMGPLYVATGTALRSTLCSASGPNGTCKHCEMLKYVKSIMRRARQAAATAMQFEAAVSPQDWHDILGKPNVSGMDDVELRNLLEYWRERALKAGLDSFNKDRKIRVLEA